MFASDLFLTSRLYFAFRHFHPKTAPLGKLRNLKKSLRGQDCETEKYKNLPELAVIYHCDEDRFRKNFAKTIKILHPPKQYSL